MANEILDGVFQPPAYELSGNLDQRKDKVRGRLRPVIELLRVRN